MVRIVLGLALLCMTLPSVAAGPSKYCEEAKGLATVTEQLPGYVLSSEARTPAKLTSPMNLKPFGLLKASRGLPVCIAVVVDASGAVLDAAAYSPKRTALSRQERKILLAQKYTPAQGENGAVKSIVLMKVSSD